VEWFTGFNFQLETSNYHYLGDFAP
jgi:hypothetical protein